MQKRLQYKHLIFREFYYSNSLSCAELSARIGKSIPLTTQILNDLMEEGIVEVKQRHVRILDTDALRRIVNSQQTCH